MNIAAANPYKCHRFPAEIIGYCVWLYFRFSLSYRNVERLMAKRGVILTYEAVRYWCHKFGQAYANQLCRWHPRPGDKWHYDERFLPINGDRHYLWRAVDQDGRERCMQRFQSSGQAQRFLSAYGLIASHFYPRRHCLAASAYRQDRQRRFRTWQEFSGTARAA